MKEPMIFNGVHVAITLCAFFTGLVYGYIVGYIDRKDRRRSEPRHASLPAPSK